MTISTIARTTVGSPRESDWCLIARPTPSGTGRVMATLSDQLCRFVPRIVLHNEPSKSVESICVYTNARDRKKPATKASRADMTGSMIRNLFTMTCQKMYE
jgi:hypothetical protein